MGNPYEWRKTTRKNVENLLFAWCGKNEWEETVWWRKKWGWFFVESIISVVDYFLKHDVFLFYHLLFSFSFFKKTVEIIATISKRAANLGCCRLRLDPLIIGSSRLNYLCDNSSTILGISIGWTKTVIQSPSWLDQVISSQKRVCSCLFCEFSLS